MLNGGYKKAGMINNGKLEAWKLKGTRIVVSLQKIVGDFPGCELT